MSMCSQFSRSELLLGTESTEILARTHAAVFGIGGVGGYVCEALARMGVGRFDLFDNDTVNITNINRQIIASHDTIGQYKVDVMKSRILSLNPNAEVNAHKVFCLPENAHEYDLTGYDYIVDAIDTVSAKIELAVRADSENIPIISSMGAGNKLNPAMFEAADIYATSVCPLARVMRRELRKRGVKSLKVVYSKEEPLTPLYSNAADGKKAVPGSVAFVPPAAGLVIASEVIKDILATPAFRFS